MTTAMTPTANREIAYREAINEAIRQEMERDERVFVFGEDVAAYGGLEGVTRGLLSRFGTERVFDTPISESGIAGLAVGASLMGMRPVVEMQFTGLTTIAMDQIANSAAKARYVHQGGLTVPMVVRTITLSCSRSAISVISERSILISPAGNCLM